MQASAGALHVQPHNTASVRPWVRSQNLKNEKMSTVSKIHTKKHRRNHLKTETKIQIVDCTPRCANREPLAGELQNLDEEEFASARTARCTVGKLQIL